MKRKLTFQKTEIALRAYIVNKNDNWKGYGSAKDETSTPDIVAVIDTETTNDQSQNLLFGSFGIWIGGKPHRFIIFYFDDLTGSQIHTLRKRVRKPIVENVKVESMSVSRFIDEIFYPCVYDAHALLVGFNLPFDISRLATDHGLCRDTWKGGFTFGLSKNSFRSPVRIKSIDSTKAFIQFTSPPRRNQRHSRRYYKGRFLDLHTLGFALTNESLTLQRACENFRTKHQKTKIEEYGRVTPESIAYNINDTLATRDLYLSMMGQYQSFHLTLPPEKVFSPASIGKQYLRQMGIKPLLEQNPSFPPKTLGNSMTTYYGGRSEVRIRKKPVKVRYMDFTSMYPSLFSLLNLWPHLIAERIECVDATREIKNLVETANLTALRNPDFWRGMVSIVRIQPNDDVLPVRSHYEQKQAYIIGINHLTSSQALWYATPDVIASKLLTGKSPRIIKAIRFIPKNKQSNLNSVKIVGNYAVSPEDNMFQSLIKLRKEVQHKRYQEAQGSPEYSTLNTLQNLLKIIANAASYGIFIEVKTRDEKRAVDVYGLEHFEAEASKKESFGDFFHPFISTMLTSGARLLLAMAETWLEQHGGYYAFCDTDSMAVSPFNWKKLQQFFEPLNPFKEGDFLKLERENYAENGKLVELWCYGISAKRYVLYYLDENGEPVPVKWSSHGLGHLLHENEEEWEKVLWANILRYALGKISKEELPAPYATEYAVAKLSLTKPHLLKRVKAINEATPTTKQIRPYNFVLVGSPCMPNSRDEPIIPLTAYVRPYDLAPHQTFTDARTGKLHTEHTELYWKKLAKMVEEYIDHPEGKFENGHRSGTMHRRHVEVDSVVHIGKESNEFEEKEILGLDEHTYVEYE